MPPFICSFPGPRTTTALFIVYDMSILQTIPFESADLTAAALGFNLVGSITEVNNRTQLSYSHPSVQKDLLNGVISEAFVTINVIIR